MGTAPAPPCTSRRRSQIAECFLIRRAAPLAQAAVQPLEIGQIQRRHRSHPHRAILQLPAELVALPQSQGLTYGLRHRDLPLGGSVATSIGGQPVTGLGSGLIPPCCKGSLRTYTIPGSMPSCSRQLSETQALASCARAVQPPRRQLLASGAPPGVGRQIDAVGVQPIQATVTADDRVKQPRAHPGAGRGGPVQVDRLGLAGYSSKVLFHPTMTVNFRRR
jgi:hypothetical protein